MNSPPSSEPRVESTAGITTTESSAAASVQQDAQILPAEPLALDPEQPILVYRPEGDLRLVDDWVQWTSIAVGAVVLGGLAIAGAKFAARRKAAAAFEVARAPQGEIVPSVTATHVPAPPKKGGGVMELTIQGKKTFISEYSSPEGFLTAVRAQRALNIQESSFVFRGDTIHGGVEIPVWTTNLRQAGVRVTYEVDGIPAVKLEKVHAVGANDVHLGVIVHQKPASVSDAVMSGSTQPLGISAFYGRFKRGPSEPSGAVRFAADDPGVGFIPPSVRKGMEQPGALEFEFRYKDPRTEAIFSVHLQRGTNQSWVGTMKPALAPV